MGLNSESRTVNAGRNALSSFANKMIVLLLTFVSRKLFIIYIGVDYLGIHGLFANVLTLLSMADLGVGTAMNVSLYRPIADNDTKRLAALLGYFKKLYRFIAAAVFVIGMALIPFLKYIVNMDRNIPHLYVYYVILVMKNVVSYLFVYKASIVKADQKNYLVNRVDILANIARVVLQCVSMIFFRSFLVYLILEVLQVAAHNLVISRVADRNYPFIREAQELTKAEKKNIFSEIGSVFLYRVSYTLLNGTDNILISVMVNTVAVGLYGNYLSVTTNLEQYVALLFTSLTASVGNLVATASSDRRYGTFKTMQMVSFMICAFVCVCLFYLMQDFISLWYGAEFVLDNATMIAIVLNTFFSVCMRPVWTFREGTGMYRRIRYIMFITAILNIVLSIVLGKVMGLAGILFATSVSKLLTYFWYEPNILFRDFFKMSVKGYYLDYARNVGTIALCFGLCWVPNTMLFGNVSVVNWLLKALVCCAVTGGVYYLRYRGTPEFANLIKKGKTFVKRLKK